MGELIRSIDWSTTSVGPVSNWPQNLRIATSIMLSTPFPMYIAWGTEYIQLYNDGYRPILGATKHPQAMGISTRETFAEVWHIIGSMFDDVMEGTAVGFPNFMLPLDRNGYVEECFFDFSYSPIYNDDGKVGGVLVTVIETTENLKNVQKLKESNLALKQSEENLRNLISHAPVAMAVFRGPDYVIEIVNEKVLELWGKTYNQVINKPVFEGLPEVVGQGIDVLLYNVFTTGERFIANELPVNLFRNGELQLVYLNFVYEALRDSDEKIYGIAAVAIEVTEQVAARKKVEEAEERARLAIEAAKIGTFDYNLLEDTIVTSPRLDEILGSVKTSDHSRYLTAFHPEDISVREKAIEKAYENGRLFYQARVVKGKETRWVQAEGKVYYDEKGKPSRLLGTMLDITEQREMQQQKDEFISIASHELKTPLTSLKAYMQLLNRPGAEQKIPQYFVDNSLKQMQRLEKLIADLLDVSKISSGKLGYNMEVFDFAELIKEAVESVQVTVSSHQLILQNNSSALVEADHYRLEQVLINYLTNAVKYSPNANKVLINAEIYDGKVIVSVKDFGMGIKEEHLPKLFDRFYRVDNNEKRYEGLGLGLYVASEIITRHSGDFWIESELGKGSVFFFQLPLINK